MTRTHGSPNGPFLLDDAMMDRLVDGELEPERRRDVIRSLSETPDGWRRCALAFLETQALREAFGEITSRAGGSVQPATGVRRGRALRVMACGIGAAAALLLAFGLGAMVAPAVGGRSGSDSARVVSEGAAVSSSQAVAIEGEGQGDDAEELWVPVVEAEEGNPMWRWLEESFAAEDVIARLEAEGHSVSKTRQLVPITLSDGRQAVLPVDEVEVRPVVYRTYQ